MEIESVNNQAEETKLHVNIDTQRSLLSSKRKLDDIEDRDSYQRVRTRSDDASIGGGHAIGSLIGKIHNAIGNGHLFASTMACLQKSRVYHRY